MQACDQGHLVSAYLDHELSAEEAARFKAHLAECPQCQETMTEIRQVDDALRQQSTRRRVRLSDCSESIADSVQRELTHSGEFTRVRRVNWVRRHRRQLLATVVGSAVLAVVWVAAMQLLAAREAPATNRPVPLEPVRQIVQPELPAVVAEGEALLVRLQREAAVPGAARRLRDEAVASGIRERLLVAESRRIAPPDPAVASLKIALTHLINLPDDNAERRARQLAAAIRESELMRRLGELRQRLLEETY